MLRMHNRCKGRRVCACGGGSVKFKEVGIITDECRRTRVVVLFLLLLLLHQTDVPNYAVENRACRHAAVHFYLDRRK